MALESKTESQQTPAATQPPGPATGPIIEVAIS